MTALQVLRRVALIPVRIRLSGIEASADVSNSIKFLHSLEIHT